MHMPSNAVYLVVWAIDDDKGLVPSPIESSRSPDGVHHPIAALLLHNTQEGSETYITASLS